MAKAQAAKKTARPAQAAKAARGAARKAPVRRLRRTADPVLTEIVRNSVVAISEEMKTNLLRTAYSMVIYEAQDFTVGLFGANGDIISIGIGLPNFIRGISDVIKAMLAHYAPGAGHGSIRPGDVLVTNDAYLTGSHLNHITLVVPIFDGKRLVAFSACMAHWADIGGALNMITRDIYSEGLQVPILKIYDQGRLNVDLVDIIRMNVRIPDRAIGDLHAQMGAVRTGAKRFAELTGRYGTQAVLDSIAAIMDHSEALARKQVRSIPDGTYSAEAYMDDDGVDVGKRVKIRVKVIVKGDSMTVDLTDVDPQVKGFFNSGEAAGRGCCQVAFKCLTSALEKPVNEGAFRPLKIILPPGRVVSAVKPAAMRRWMTYPMTVVDTIFKALAPAIPGRVIAGHHAELMSALINGNHPGDGKLYILYGGLIGGGWGARQGMDGSSATICINDGDTHNSPLEQVEAKYPVLVDRYCLREDSAGAGKWQGGFGTEKSVRATHDFMFNAQVERVHCRPWGLFGGHPGAGNQVAVQIRDEPELRFPSGKVLGRLLRPGEAYILRSGGGGGYGLPLDRPLEKIQADLDEGYITRERAEGCYGAVLGADGRIDLAASEARRAQMRGLGLNLERPDETAVPDAAAAAGDDAAAERFLTQGMLFPSRCC